MTITSESARAYETSSSTQKFEGAAVGAFNANIIVRDLGLRDKQEIEHSGQIDKLSDLTAATIRDRIAAYPGRLEELK